MRIGYDPEVRYRHLEIDAKARIAWGHDAKRVESFLRANEMPSGRIHRIVNEATEQRDQAFRRRGLWDLTLAGLILLIALLPAALPVALEEGLRAGVEMLGPFEYLVLMVAAWLTAQGTTRLAFGGKGESGAEHATDPVNQEIAWQLQYGTIVVVLVIIGVVAANLLR